MNDIVITGAGLITPLGNGLKANEEALRQGRSGIKFMPDWQEINMESCVAGISDEDPESPLLNIKNKRFMTPNSKMAVAATYQALTQAELAPEELKHKRIALILGCAGSAYKEVYKNSDTFMKTRKVKKVSPFVVPKVMPSSAVSNLSLILGITGESYDISSACTSSAHSIMLSTRFLKAGLYDIIITGGTEEVNWIQALGFNAIRAISRKYNDRPQEASRPFDRDRDGFVIAEGAGIVILETLTHARTRGVEPIGIISGTSANSNGTDMVVPNAEYSSQVMKMAIDDAGLKPSDITYINTHGTSTPTGDPVELDAIKKVFRRNADKVAVNSTKSMTGHMIGATGAVEAIYCMMMMNGNFICPSINLENPDDGYEWVDYVRETRDNVNFRHCLSNSFGFGGTNASLVISRPD